MGKTWQRIRDWFDDGPDAKEVAASETVPVDLVVALREAADDVGAAHGEIDRAVASRPGDDFTQARLYAASAKLLELIADGLTKDVIGVEQESTERWRSDYATALYRRVLDVVERTRLAVARPPAKPTAVKVAGFLMRQPLPPEADVVELLALNDRLRQHFEADISYARATRGGAEQMRLNELLGVLRSRMNTSETLCYARLSGGFPDDREQLLGRSVFDEILALWSLVVQELVCSDITADLALGPDATAGGKYDPDNVWLMTDPVARARYELEGRLDELEQDIRFEILRGRPFSADDVTYARQIDWLEQTGVVKRLASYWATSPHSPIFRARQAGQIRLTGRVHDFDKGDDIVWLCQMGREMVGHEECVFVGNLRTSRMRQLCGAMSNAMMDAKMKRMM